MKYSFCDYNDATTLLLNEYDTEWSEIEQVLATIPLYIKDSDQKGKQGSKIFNPVGTNKAIEDGLRPKGWILKMPIPPQFNFLGTDIDFVKKGILVEAQFSNYPFLLNNIQRSELFYKAGITFSEEQTKMLIIITKCHLLPASNSTLYYEQAKSQLDALSENKVFSIPARLIGLTEGIGVPINVRDVTYDNARYSRTESEVHEKTAIIYQSKPESRGVIAIQ